MILSKSPQGSSYGNTITLDKVSHNTKNTKEPYSYTNTCFGFQIFKYEDHEKNQKEYRDGDSHCGGCHSRISDIYDP